MLGTPQCIFSTLPLADVSGNSDDVVAVEFDEFHTGFHRKSGPVFSPVNGLLHHESGIAQFIDDSYALGFVDLGIDVEYRHRQQLIACIAQVFAGLLVDIEELKGLRIDDFHGIVGVINQCSEKFQRAFRLIAISDVLQDTGDSVDALWTIDWKVGDGKLSLTQRWVDIAHFVLDNLATEAFIQLFLDDGLKNIGTQHFFDGSSDQIFWFHPAIAEKSTIGDHVTIVAVNYGDHLFQAIDRLLEFVQPLRAPPEKISGSANDDPHQDKKAQADHVASIPDTRTNSGAP